MNKIRSTKGITLVALVITIIILLILAGVTINVTIGENGLFNTAKQAAIKTEIASIKERIQTDIYAEQIENKGNISDVKLKEILEEYGTLSKEDKITDKTLETYQGNHKIKVSDIFNGTTVDSDVPDKNQANEPNVSKIAQKTYVTWNLNEKKEYVINDEQTTAPDNWYDYENGKWANIKTTKVNTNPDGTTETLEAYWVWIPRYEYIVPTSTSATEIEVKFIPASKKQADKGYIIHPAFTNEGNGGFGELDGIWVAKFEAGSSTPTASNGGGNDPSLKVQVIPDNSSWRGIETKNMFSVCRKMTSEKEVLAGSTVNSHMMKNIEWGAVAILSQSKYGVYNPESMNGIKGNREYQVWNNPSTSRTTGSVGTSKDDSNQSSVQKYNSENGPKASTTGTVYGVYDMAGGCWEYVAGCINGQEKDKFGVETVDSKYVDLYTNSSDNNDDYDGAKVGDATAEAHGWNEDHAFFINSYTPVFRRGR